MKKIGILTLHFSENYGAVLQCYALRRVINSISGYSADIINFMPNDKTRWYNDKFLQQKYEGKLELYKKINEVENGIVTEPICDINDLDLKEYYAFIVGSDQVWNTSYKLPTSIYLLDFVKEEQKKISYAASIGLSIDDPLLKKELFEKYIPRFDSLSIREDTHVKFIESFTDKKVQTVLDPTLLLTKEDYDELISDLEQEKNEDGDYILFYYLKNDNRLPLACSFVNMLARKYNLKIIHYLVETPEQLFKNENKSFYFEGPKDFLWYVKHAKIVVTNSFHGTIFSILYHKPFYTYVVKSIQSRVMDLVKTLELQNRLILEYKSLNEVTFEIDYENVDKILEKEREKSIKFLKDSLKEN